MSLLDILKHLPGKHSQVTHTPHSASGQVRRTLASGKMLKLNGEGAEQDWDAIVAMLPTKAKAKLENSRGDISFFNGVKKPSESGYYEPGTYSPSHRIAWRSGNTLAGLEEIGHLLDAELSRAGYGNNTYSRGKAWEAMSQKEPLKYIGTNIATAKWYGSSSYRSEAFAKTFVDYIIRPEHLKANYPLHYEAHRKLWE